MPSGVYKRKGHQIVPDEKRRAIYAEYIAGGTTYPQLAEKYKIDRSTVARVVQQGHNKKLPSLPPVVPVSAIPEPETLTVQAGKPAPGRPVGRWAEFKPQILSLKEQGYGRSEIATKLAIPVTNVAYYLFQANKKPNEGAASNGHESLDTRFLVGFGCAELERTLTAIAQRLGIAPALLRQGFSRFLGSTAVR